MATWIIHLRIAEKLIDIFPSLRRTEFIVGNIAPDSGRVQDDGITYVPSKSVSHFYRNGNITPSLFEKKYLSPAPDAARDEKRLSFCLGYLAHLVTDAVWSDGPIMRNAKEKCGALWESDRSAAAELIKRDWYDLDFLYLEKHPDFEPLRIFAAARGFENIYIAEYGRDDFDKKRREIVDFYAEEHYNLDREYKYMTEADADSFVGYAAGAVSDCMKAYITGEQQCPKNT